MYNTWLSRVSVADDIFFTTVVEPPGAVGSVSVQGLVPTAVYDVDIVEGEIDVVKSTELLSGRVFHSGDRFVPRLTSVAPAVPLLPATVRAVFVPSASAGATVSLPATLTPELAAPSHARYAVLAALPMTTWLLALLSGSAAPAPTNTL